GNENEIVQIGICFEGTRNCRTSAALTESFYAPFRGRLRVVVSHEEGAVLGVSWRAWVPSSSASSSVSTGEKEEEEMAKGGRYQEGGKGDFDMVVQQRVPRVWVDKAPAKGGKSKGAAAGTGEKGKGDGEGEEEAEERTFLQKYVLCGLLHGGSVTNQNRYWWVILAVTIFAMAGGGPEK
ncbi:MAG: hypothetical protein Q9179_003199, partial [Wetmoreana sp. 5 TL-2023]